MFLDAIVEPINPANEINPTTVAIILSCVVLVIVVAIVVTFLIRKKNK
jgi:phosphotransferase system  glucose/maltose/N-acetylglucosamine-specific IIC component